MTETLSSICENNLGGLQKLILFRAKEVVAITSTVLQLADPFTATHILFPDNNAEYQEALRESENGPFVEVSISASVGKNNADLRAWCNRNRRQKFVAVVEDQNGFQFIVGNPRFPLAMGYASATGQSDQDRNNFQISLRGRILNPQEGFGGLIPVEEPNVLVTENPEVFIVTDSGDFIEIQ